MGDVIVVTSGKGGVGKTTAVANLGMGLAMNGHKVVLVDADLGLRNLDLVLGLDSRVVFHLVDVINQDCRLKQALIRDKRCENLYLLPAAQTKDKTAVTPEQMKQLCDDLRQDFDFVLIDCPAGIERGFKNAIAGADRAIVVSTPEVSSMRDADRVIGLLDAYDKGDPKLIINRIRPDMVKRGDMMGIDDMIDMLAIDVLGVIPEDEYIVVSTNRGEPAVSLDTSRASTAYRNIVRRLLGDNVPLMPLVDRDYTVWTRVKKIFGLA